MPKKESAVINMNLCNENIGSLIDEWPRNIKYLLSIDVYKSPICM